MTPGPFEGINANSEYELCERAGYAEAERRLRHHWDTFITEQDIIQMKAMGINHIRIPFGYWALDIKNGEPWVSGSWDYVVRACGWARTHGLQVMLDLHGAPGSQNGNDHSGVSGPINFYYNDENLSRSVNVLRRAAQQFATAEWRDTVTIIQLLNEPVIWDDYNYRLGRLRQFYLNAYDAIRSVNPEIVIAVHDAFIGYENWYYLRDEQHYHLMMLDTHLYQVFGDGWGSITCTQHTNHACNYRGGTNGAPNLTAANNKLWTVVGEWSVATPGQLNCNQQATYMRRQLGVYETAGSGWFMWSWKHPLGWNEWSYADCNRLGVVGSCGVGNTL
jgi:glucan 1,3-beta-glucosidase